MSRAAKKPARAPLTNGPVFDPPAVRELFSSQVLATDRLKMPSEAALARLAEILETWRLFYVAEQNLIKYRKAQRAALGALKALGDAAEIIEQINREFLDAAITKAELKWITDALRARVAEVAEIREFMGRAQGFGALSDRGMGQTAGWKWLAAALRGDFLAAMRSTNPNIGEGIGHAGPLPRFVAAIAPLLTGERPTIESVVTTLKARRAIVTEGKIAPGAVFPGAAGRNS